MEIEPQVGHETKVKQRIESDDSLNSILRACLPLLFEQTSVALNNLWSRLDWVHDGVLRQKDFQSVRGIDRIWEDLLDACDVDGDGSIGPAEFVAGFVLAALDKEMLVRINNLKNVTGLEVMKSVAIMINEHIMEEIEIVKTKMGWYL
mmetsp:Transcript_18573/g.27222  ORF Transcript_18573/g.27222 Transcript_18573/m.27222 type:complete len:148 (-) Transcript_18573:321-764(-)|eukprot:CAMPEP_0195509740 /NCGR_PEP_ID=MMETSP0794_2-20130614/2590_1 /TAXON_ID=515487 /ORGANISM="Stephanopyxis turris, Strain CCMP 815" /LENGTH=147 /DNA_ID=CAMNT_0040637031 /DNA_START=155 /DNA_END=598 /DNA_ORIENTATION=+